MEDQQVKPKHTLPDYILIRPSETVQKSSYEYPAYHQGYRDFIVDGSPQNPESTGILQELVSSTRLGKRKDLLRNVIKAIINVKLHETNEHETDPKKTENLLNFVLEDENNADEILDESQENGDNKIIMHPDYRRKRSKKSQFRDREKLYSSDSSSTDSEDDSTALDYEKNPGNPYTVKGNKYKQNWIWNHFMDGDHMNINPYGPKLQSGGPTGHDIFYNRKWWYYNQDDYKPLG